MEDDAPAASPWPIKHKLARPIPGPSGDISELEFREPLAGDIMRCGFPVIYDPFREDEPVKFDERKMTAFMAALSKVPETSLSKMTTSDWFFCATLIARFL